MKYSFLISKNGVDVSYVHTPTVTDGQFDLEQAKALYRKYKAAGIAGLYCQVGDEQRLAEDVKRLAQRGVRVTKAPAAPKASAPAAPAPTATTATAYEAAHTVTITVATQYSGNETRKAAAYKVRMTCGKLTKDFEGILETRPTNARAALVGLKAALKALKYACSVTVNYGKPEMMNGVKHAMYHEGKTLGGKLSANAADILSMRPLFDLHQISFVEASSDPVVAELRRDAADLLKPATATEATNVVEYFNGEPLPF